MIWNKLGDGGRLVADMAELALQALGPAEFWSEAMALLSRAIGFDAGYVATTPGTARDAHGALIGYDETFLRTQIGRFVREFSPSEVAAYTDRARRGDEVWGRARKAELAVFYDHLQPAGTRALLVRASCRRDVLLGINFERRSFTSPFSDRALGLVDMVAPIIHIADVLGRTSPDESAAFDAWAEQHELGHRERQITELVVRGLRNAEVARILGVSPFTVRNVLNRIFGKVDVSTRAELVFAATSGPKEPVVVQRKRADANDDGLRLFVERVQRSQRRQGAVGEPAPDFAMVVPAPIIYAGRLGLSPVHR